MAGWGQGSGIGIITGFGYASLVVFLSPTFYLPLGLGELRLCLSIYLYEITAVFCIIVGFSLFFFFLSCFVLGLLSCTQPGIFHLHCLRWENVNMDVHCGLTWSTSTHLPTLVLYYFYYYCSGITVAGLRATLNLYHILLSTLIFWGGFKGGGIYFSRSIFIF